MEKDQNKLVIKNKRAAFEFHFLLELVAGIQLTGTEIKSLREGKASIAEAYCIFEEEELYIKNMHIAAFEQGSHFNHQPMRVRKLLLKKQELRKLQTKLKDVGLTIIPVKLFISKTGYAKLEIALAKGKKLYDKREDIKEKDLKRQMDRSLL